MKTEQLGRSDDDAAFSEWQHFELGREASGREHRALALVLQVHIVDDDSVEEPKIHSSYADLCTQFVRQRTSYCPTNGFLYCRHLQQYDDKCI